MPRLPRRLTKSMVDALEARNGEQQTFYWDPELVGFGLRVSRSGHKSYVVKRRNHRMVLDRVSVLSVEDARQRAIEFLAKVGRGENPIEERRLASARSVREASRDLTLWQAWEAYRIAKKQLRPRTRDEYEYALKTYCAEWHGRPLRALTRDFVSAEHTRIRELVAGRGASRLATGNSTANGVMRVVRAVWNFAAEQELVLDLGRNPVGTLSVNRAWYPEVVRDEYIPLVDLPAFHRAVLEFRSPSLADPRAMTDLVRLMLFTGLRLGEARSMRWENVDIRRGMIRLTAEQTKARRRLDLPLTAYVVRLLEARPRNSEWVFPGSRTHVIDPRPVLRYAASELAKHHASADVRLSYHSPHSLRRTFVTVAESCDLSSYALKALVNHSFGSDVTAGYIGRDIDRLRAAARKVADRLEHLVNLGPATAGESGTRLSLSRTA